MKIPTDKVAKVLQHRPGCDLGYLLGACTGYSWSQVFTAIVWMGRKGLLYVVDEQPGKYSLILPDTWIHQVLRKKVHQGSVHEPKATMHFRWFSRMRTQGEVLFRGAHFMGNGMVLDVSEHGARITTSSLDIEPGMQLKLRLHVFPFQSPVKVDVATVRWRKQKAFGVEFMLMRQEEREQLRALIRESSRSS